MGTQQHPTVAAGVVSDEPQITVVDDPSSTQANPPLLPPSNHPSIPRINGSKLTEKTKNRASDDSASSSSSAISSQNPVLNHNQRGIRISGTRRNPRFSVRRSATNVEAIAFPLGMSIAVVLTQVLERKDLTNEKISIDQLSMICTSAVRESLSNVFGDKFDAFARNFEKSFGSTLSTLRLIKNSSVDNGKDQVGHSRDGPHVYTTSTICLDKGQCSLQNCDVAECSTESTNCTFVTEEHLEKIEEVEDNQPADFRDRELSMQRHTSQQLTESSYSGKLSVVSTIEKSVIEQTRANDLKSVEIGLIMRKLKLKEKQLSLNSDLNFLERCKLSLGHARTSFKAEKLKNQLEETRHSELLRTCADFLVTDLLIMLMCLGYGVYAFSYDRIHQLTKSCTPPLESKSWWIPRPMSSFNSGLQSLNCQLQIYSRMIFGALMILAIAYVLIQRSAISTAAMPITFMVLLLGAGCGFVGKFCVDTLGGNGNHWLIYWEILCALHFFANVFTPFLFYILNGAVQVALETKSPSVFPYWIRRWLFYLTLLLVPVCCGLLPFASPRKWWEEHFSKLIKNHMLATYGENYDDVSGLHE